MKASTERFAREARERGLSWWNTLHGYVYMRWPDGYIGSAIGEKPGLRWLRLFFWPFLARALFPQRWGAEYHGKVVPTEQARRLVVVQEDVNLAVPEQVIPFETARQLVLRRAQPIALLRCPCRVSHANPCLPLEVCIIVGDPFAPFIVEHHPDQARYITPEEAVAVLEAEAARGHVHHAFFKQAVLGRFYAICNCCSCCCGAMSAHQYGTPMLISSGLVAQVEEARCQKCGRCTEICPFGATSAPQRVTGGVNPPVVDTQACMGCGVCVRACPNGALALVRAADKPAPLEWPTAAS